MEQVWVKCQECNQDRVVPEGHQSAKIDCRRCANSTFPIAGNRTTPPGSSVQTVCSGCGGSFGVDDYKGISREISMFIVELTERDDAGWVGCPGCKDYYHLINPNQLEGSGKVRILESAPREKQPRISCGGMGLR